MPASQHQQPKSDIEISQAAKKRPILDVARERLGIAPQDLEPYGHYKAKLSMDFVKSLQSRPNGKLRPRQPSASPTRSIISAKRQCCACASRRSGRRSG
jgi:hypothetical protein